MGRIKRVIKKYLLNICKHLVPEAVGQAEKTAKYEVCIKDVNRLMGKNIIVTGATGAIGTAICRRLLIEGANVGIAGRNMSKVKFAADKLTSEYADGGAVIPLYLDVNDHDSVEKAVDEFVSKTGSLDAFINNAGGSARAESKLLYEQDMDVINKVITTNLSGSIDCARKAAQIMTAQKYGKIINMSSVVGMCGKKKMTDYSAAKSGILGFTKSMAMELGEYGITVNCISPGMVNQIPFDAGLPVKATNANCLGRYGYTDEVAGLVAFILSDDCNYITGHNFVIDGGRSLGLMGD